MCRGGTTREASKIFLKYTLVKKFNRRKTSKRSLNKLIRGFDHYVLLGFKCGVSVYLVKNKNKPRGIPRLIVVDKEEEEETKDTKIPERTSKGLFGDDDDDEDEDLDLLVKIIKKEFAEAA